MHQAPPPPPAWFFPPSDGFVVFFRGPKSQLWKS